MKQVGSVKGTPYRYHAFGLNIHSDIQLPELPVDTLENNAHIHILLTEANSQLKAPVSESNHFAITPSAALLKGDEFALTIVDGQKIMVHCDQVDEHLALIRLRILGAGIGLLLQQRGYLVLHGATVVGDKGAAVILGESGDGKSTLCAQLINRGYRLLGDDKCIVKFFHKSLYALPSIPFIKLSKNSVEPLGFSEQETRAIAVGHDKVYVNLGEAFEYKPVPIIAAFVLGRANEVSLSQLTQMHTFNTFIQHSYRKQKFIGGGLHKMHFTQCQQMAKSLSMYQYLRPLSGEALSEPSPIFLKAIEELIGCDK